ncbi:MAG: hypothetical protein A3J94_05125 [Syntrophus sp. RIFOXYC2_FULL_54_9]|nr:MAG: hypothetical protein A3J94_05125 [Syntrophus sp. RIFOXYC2_FULL_54_9]
MSKFENENTFVNFRNPGVTTRDISEFISQPSDNDNYKLSMQGAVRQLPLNSALALQLGYPPRKALLPIADFSMRPTRRDPEYSWYECIQA